MRAAVAESNAGSARRAAGHTYFATAGPIDQAMVGWVPVAAVVDQADDPDVAHETWGDPTLLPTFCEQTFGPFHPHTPRNGRCLVVKPLLSHTVRRSAHSQGGNTGSNPVGAAKKVLVNATFWLGRPTAGGQRRRDA
jgi:hypothetical protein